MEQKTLYTAIGRLERETNGCGRSCPVIRLGGQPCMVDMQELVVWTALNWRISKWEDISFQCDIATYKKIPVHTTNTTNIPTIIFIVLLFLDFIDSSTSYSVIL